MINSSLEYAIGFIIMLSCFGISILSIYKTDKSIISFSIIGFGIIIGIAIFYIANVDYMKEQLAQELKGKSIVDSLSCKGLGSYIINNSSNSTSEDSVDVKTKIYKYAEAKYLVCTHGGIS